MSKALRINQGLITEIEAQPNDLAWLQSQVGGYIEQVDGENEVIVLGNEEAKLDHMNMKPNVVRWDGEVLHGPLLVLGTQGEYYRGLTQYEINNVVTVNKSKGLPLLVIDL